MAVLGGLAAVALLALPVAVVVVVVRLSRRGEAGAEPSTRTLRRFLQYTFLLAALLLAATGLSLVLAHALPGQRVAELAARDLALGLSLTLVGAPVWLALWRLVARQLVHDARERTSLAWTLYLAAAATVALVVALVNLVRVGAWATGAGDLEAAALAAAVVWTVVWAGHARLAGDRALAPTGPSGDAVVLSGAAVGLVALALGASGVLSFGLHQIYRVVVVADVLGEPATTETLRRYLVLALLAGAAWWWYWLRRGARGPRSTLWHLHVLLLGTLGGLLAAASGTAVALAALLQWVLRAGVVAGPVAHFEVLPGALTAVTVGAWSWWYHRAVLGEQEGLRRGEPERVYEHLAAAVGLVAAAAGVASAIVAAVQAVTAPLAGVDPGGRTTLATALTLLAVGTPLWGVYWRRLQRHALADGEERASPSRRAYLFLLFGATGLTASVSVAVTLFVSFRDLLEGSLGTATLHGVRAAVALALTAGLVSGYHWRVYRQDRAGRPETVRQRTVLLVVSDGSDLAERLAARTGARVRRLDRLDGASPAPASPGGPVDAAVLAEAVLSSPHERLLVVVDGDGDVRVIPYEPG